jgi:class 3 adenylate cyclase
VLPTGTVTFLFTDLEDSTRLWERDPEAMRAAAARHDDLLLACVAHHDGSVVKSTGDGFMIAFADATQAVTAAITGQFPSRCEWACIAGLLSRSTVTTTRPR